MSDKLEALKAAALAATPGPWYRSSVTFNGITSEQTFMTQGNKPHIANAGEKRDAIFIAAANPDVVLSLLAALEEKDQELDKEGDILIDTQESMREWKLRANAAEQREEHLKATVDVLSAKNAELEQRLQQPIKIVQFSEFEIEHMISPEKEGYSLGWIDGRNSAAADVVRAGFKVEGGVIMIKPIDNEIAAGIIAHNTGMANYNIFGPSFLAQDCLALIKADRYLSSRDTAPPAPAVPDAKPEIDYGEGGSDIDYMQPQEIYDMGKVDGWNAYRTEMLAAAPTPTKAGE